MKRVVIFAHYDKDNVIDDYVIYYLKSLKKVSEYIVFVSCCNIIDSEKQKLSGIADHLICEKHDEYDFGSYKRGFLYLIQKGNLNDFDEISFINDSCYGPLFDLEPIFDKMSENCCDFWGISVNNFGYYKTKSGKFKMAYNKTHLQSYFLTFKKNVFTSDIFKGFIKSVTHHEDKRDVILNYEMGLTKSLAENGFVFDYFIKKYNHINNVAVRMWYKIIPQCAMPLFKCSLPRLFSRSMTFVEGYENVIKSVSDYPIELIHKNVLRTKSTRVRSTKLPLKIRKAVFSLIHSLPYPYGKFLAAVTTEKMHVFWD